jgi:hypothetical protein
MSPRLAAATTDLDLGNNETISRGISCNSDGTFLAITFSQSRTFKTRRGAERWLARRGLRPDGSRRG